MDCLTPDGVFFLPSPPNTSLLLDFVNSPICTRSADTQHRCGLRYRQHERQLVIAFVDILFQSSASVLIVMYHFVERDAAACSPDFLDAFCTQIVQPPLIHFQPVCDDVHHHG